MASQERLHRAAEDLRQVCLADIAAAETLRRELMRAQAEGDLRCEAVIAMARARAARDVIRQQWARDRCWMVGARDAVAIGLGWPHRGELVTIDTWYGPDGDQVHVTGEAVYENSSDTHNVGHQVWVPQLSADRHRGTLGIYWQPCQGRWGNADPAGDIGLRMRGAGACPLPVPLPRWPQPEDIAGGADPVRSVPAGAQLELFR